MRYDLRLVFLALAVLMAGSALSCQTVKRRLGISETIRDPAVGTPEKVVQDVLKAAANPDDEEGFLQFSRTLHTEETEAPIAMKGWKEMKFPSIRRKADYFITDKATTSYKLLYRSEEGSNLLLFVVTSQSDYPTPCRLKKDPAQGNAWKVISACL